MIKDSYEFIRFSVSSRDYILVPESVPGTISWYQGQFQGLYPGTRVSSRNYILVHLSVSSRNLLLSLNITRKLKVEGLQLHS